MLTYHVCNFISEFQRYKSDIYANLLEDEYFSEPDFKSTWNMKYSQVCIRWSTNTYKFILLLKTLQFLVMVMCQFPGSGLKKGHKESDMTEQLRIHINDIK